MDTTRPAMIAPVSRTLAVADAARSQGFYRDVLGFDLDSGDTEAVYGPVKIRFIGKAEDAKARCVLFFETGDVTAMHEFVASRGAAPSAVERVNWIKMRMFEVRDPDGHTLWFGQSFHQPPIEMHTPPGDGQLRQIMPAMPLSDVASGIAHYRDVLGFKVNYAQEDLGVMDRDSVRILLTARKEKGRGACYAYVRDADALHAELVTKGAKVQGKPESHPWGLRDFRVLDLEGNEITFGQTFE